MPWYIKAPRFELNVGKYGLIFWVFASIDIISGRGQICTNDNKPGYSADPKCWTSGRLDESPCLVTHSECNFAIQPVNIDLTPYPVCLPNSECSKTFSASSNLIGINGNAVPEKLYLNQKTAIFISDTSQLNHKRLRVRSYMDLGRLGCINNTNVPVCIVNNGAKHKTAPLEYAYGTCELDTYPEGAQGEPGSAKVYPLCDLIASDLLRIIDASGNVDIVSCINGVLQFTPESDCAKNQSCTVYADYTSFYEQVQNRLFRAVMRRFLAKELTIHVEVFQMESYPGDESHLVVEKESNEACRQHVDLPRCLGYFYTKLYTSP